MNNQFRIKHSLCLLENSDAVCNFYVDSGLNDPSMIGNGTHDDFSDKNLGKVRFVPVNRMPAVEEQLAAKYYVDQAISNGVDDSTSVRNNQDKNPILLT